MASLSASTDSKASTLDSNPHPTSLNSDSASPLASTSTADSISSSIQSLSVHSDQQEQSSNQNHTQATSVSPSLSPSSPIDKSFQDHHNRQFIDLVNGKLKDDCLKFPIMPSHQRNIVSSTTSSNPSFQSIWLSPFLWFSLFHILLFPSSSDSIFSKSIQSRIQSRSTKQNHFNHQDFKFKSSHSSSTFLILILIF